MQPVSRLVKDCAFQSTVIYLCGYTGATVKTLNTGRLYLRFNETKRIIAINILKHVKLDTEYINQVYAQRRLKQLNISLIIIKQPSHETIQNNSVESPFSEYSHLRTSFTKQSTFQFIKLESFCFIYSLIGLISTL